MSRRICCVTTHPTIPECIQTFLSVYSRLRLYSISRQLSRKFHSTNVRLLVIVLIKSQYETTLCSTALCLLSWNDFRRNYVMFSASQRYTAEHSLLLREETSIPLVHSSLLILSRPKLSKVRSNFNSFPPSAALKQRLLHLLYYQYSCFSKMSICYPCTYIIIISFSTRRLCQMNCIY